MFTDPAGEDAGRTVYPFLTLPVSARQLATGLAAWPGGGDAADVFGAPASTASMSRYRFAVTHLEWLMGLRKEYAGACIPILDVGTLGFYSQVFTYGGFDNARDIDERPAEVKAVDYSIGASFARRFLSDKLAAGATVSYVQSILAGEPAASASCNLDLLYTPTDRLRARLVGRHLGPPATYARSRELQPAEAGLSVHLAPFPPLDDSVSPGPRLRPEAGIGVLKTADGPLKAGIGMELRIVNQFFVRAGYEYAYGHEPSVAGLSAGVGLSLGAYGMDAGWRYQSRDFGSVWSATVRYATEELRPKTAMEYYLIAEKHFHRGRNRQAIRYAHKALGLNPDLWQAHSLLARTASRIRREQGSEIGLVYAGNLRGHLAPRRSGGVSLGGIARSAAAVRALKAEYPLCLAIEAGNLLDASSTEEQAAVAAAYTAKAGFEVAGVGPGEVRFGLDRYPRTSGRVERVGTNLTRLGGARVRDAALVSLGDRTVAVLAAIDPFLWSEGAGGLWFEPMAEAVADRLRSASVRNCDLRVLIFHGPWQSLRELLPRVEGIDIVLCGSQSQRFEQPMMLDSTIVLSAGEMGHYAGALTLRFDGRGRLISYDNRLVPITEDIEGDPELRQAVERVMPQSEDLPVDTAMASVVRTSTEGLFAFVSDRRGTPHIFLKAPRRHAEFPLTTGHRPCGRPRLSLSSRRLVYTVHDDSLQTTGVRITNLLEAGSEPLPAAGHIDEVRFHPEGGWIYTVATPEGDTAAHIHRTKGAGAGSLPVVAWENTSARWLRISPDGRNIVFAASAGLYWQIHVADTAGATPIQITEARGNHIEPTVSPDGRYLAYRSDRSGLTGQYDLWVHDRETGAEARLTRTGDVHEYCWYADGRTLVFSAGNPALLRTVDVGLAVSDLLTKRAPDAPYEETAPRLLDYAGTVKIVYVRAYRDGKRQLHWVEIDGSNDRRISESGGSEWLE